MHAGTSVLVGLQEVDTDEPICGRVETIHCAHSWWMHRASGRTTGAASLKHPTANVCGPEREALSLLVSVNELAGAVVGRRITLAYSNHVWRLVDRSKQWPGNENNAKENAKTRRSAVEVRAASGLLSRESNRDTRCKVPGPRYSYSRAAQLWEQSAVRAKMNMQYIFSGGPERALYTGIWTETLDS